MLTHNGKQYHLRYSLKRIEQIETAMGKGLMAELAATKGMFSISDMKVACGYALKNEDENYVSPAQGMQIIEDLIEEDYVKVFQEMVEALERDCPFFFRAD